MTSVWNEIETAQFLIFLQQYQGHFQLEMNNDIHFLIRDHMIIQTCYPCIYSTLSVTSVYSDFYFKIELLLLSAENKEQIRANTWEILNCFHFKFSYLCW